jgi:hypothetical protein
LIPGKFNPTWGSAYIAWRGQSGNQKKEIRKEVFLVRSTFLIFTYKNIYFK